MRSVKTDPTYAYSFNREERTCETDGCTRKLIPNSPNHIYCKKCQKDRAKARSHKRRLKQLSIKL